MTRSPPSPAPPVTGRPDTTPVVDRSDAGLVRGVLLREVDAYTELRRRHLHSVTGVARALLGTRAGTEDVVADVFVAFWLDPYRFDPRRGTVLAFLRMNARGRSIDLLRSDTARTRREVTAPVHTMATDLDARIIDAETNGGVRAAMERLPILERRPIELAFFAGLTYGAVAVRLGLPEGTVKSRIRRGLQRMGQMEGLQSLREEPGPVVPGPPPALAIGGGPPSLEA